MASRHALFCYGTLCLPSIMQAVSGHKSSPQPAQLANYQSVSLHGRRFPAIIARAGQLTEGVLYPGLTAAQLRRIDHYEGDMYTRSRVLVSTPQDDTVVTWTYVLHPRYYRLINKQPWSLAEFMARYQAAYQYQHGW